MATNFPASLDSLTNPTSSDSLNSPSHSAQHANVNDAVEALQAKVGADSSAVTTSLDYKVAQLEAISHGKILQVVSTTKVDAFTMSSGGFTDVTGLSATITPTSATSKILVIASVSISAQTGYNAYLNLVRNSTNISQSTGGTSNMTKTITAGIFWFHPTVVFEDSPATTSATTYKIQVRAENTAGGVAVNRRYDSAAYGSTSSITVMEVSA